MGSLSFLYFNVMKGFKNCIMFVGKNFNESNGYNFNTKGL